ncbi:MAG: type II toxin-antitoxin system HipA family toxin [Parachlamydiaceae bacterium]|nr:type II toxin-antitoxin system HipA family toxin [Parachlamydiaceae bacterium]
MITKNSSIIHVYYTGRSEKLAVGRLALKEHRIFFEYDSEFLKTGLEMSPFKLPLKSGIFAFKDHLFDGLFGVFNDSLPDGWGRLLVDRKLIQLGINPGALSPIDRLLYVGSRGMGALAYEPEVKAVAPSHHEDLDQIANETFQFQENNNDDRFIDDLLALNGSSAGARPKILVKLKEDSFLIADEGRGTSNNEWIIKFRSFLDPMDIGPIEYAFHLMAEAANLDVPEAKLFKSKNGFGYFGVKRFDRLDGRNIHMHTISGLLHADHRIPSLDYEAIMKTTLWLTKSGQECEKQFRAAVFNVLTHNRDDHAKNFSFLMDEKGLWRVSPAYDLVFSSGPAGEHCTMVMGEGKKPKREHLLKLGEIVSLKKSTALKIIEDVKQISSKWPHFANEAGVCQKSLEMIQLSLTKIAKGF